MALLQISEPGMSPAPHQRRLAVGIDLGTTNSLVAAVRNSIPEVLPDEHGRALLPSVVRYLPNGNAHIGYKAQDEAVRETVAILKQADLAPLEVQAYGTLDERLAEGHEVPDEERALMDRARDENSVIVAQFEPFFDEPDHG